MIKRFTAWLAKVFGLEDDLPPLPPLYVRKVHIGWPTNKIYGPDRDAARKCGFCGKVVEGFENPGDYIMEVDKFLGVEGQTVFVCPKCGMHNPVLY